jgi:GT2 family glycosyltransferase
MKNACSTFAPEQLSADMNTDDIHGRDANDRSGLRTPVLSIICVNWNSMQYLVDCLESAYSNPPDASFEIIVVDNASTEGGADSLIERFPLVRLIQSDRNLGFAAANNLGFRHSSGEYILLLNPDTVVIGSALTLMLNGFCTHPDAGIVGCKLLNSDGSISTTSIQKFPTILNQMFTAEWLRLRLPSFSLWNIAPLFSENHSPVKVEVIPGACLMLKRKAFESAGLLTEDYFMYAEDIDINFKVRKHGFSSYYVGDAQIIHHGGRSSDQQPLSQWSTVMMQRAMLRYFRINHGVLYAAAYRAMMGLSASVRLFLLYVLLPIGKKHRIKWAIAKWRVILRWALGLERTETN